MLRPISLCGFLILIGFVATIPAQGQQKEPLPSVDEVLDAFYEALGGEMAMAGMNQVQFGGTYNGPSAGTLKVAFKEGKYLLDYELEGFGNIRQGFDGESWWRAIPGEDVEKLGGFDMVTASQYAICTPQFLDWRDFEGEVEIVEATEFRGADVWHLRFSNAAGIEVDRYFDRDSGLLVATRMNAEAMNLVNIYEFEDVQGVMWVSRIESETRINGADDVHSTQLEFSDYQFDIELDDRDFAMPDNDDSDD